MATTPEQIDLWRQSPSEYQRLEFKEAKTQFDDRKAQRHLKWFVELGLLRRVGAGPATEYRVVRP